MSDAPSHEYVENVYANHVKPLLDKLPDSIESREAKRLTDITVDLVHQSVEQTEAKRSE